MFAKLKKKIEEEVGDLGQLTSPMANPFGSGDRRVGGSTQGTNTPNNLGSRQSSLASLVDLHSIPDEPTSPNPNVNLSAQSSANRTSNSAAASVRQKSQEIADAEVKKLNTEWIRKFESMKKSYEERIQNQEADFAWRYSSKEEELERVRIEKKKTEETIKTMEGSYQNRMTRVQDDMDQLEGFAKQETAKVKHLLLNTQADLQKAQGDLIEQVSLGKELTEENRNLKAENESILRNLDRDRLNRVKFEAEHGETIAEIADLHREIQKRSSSLSELRGTLDATMTQLRNAQADLGKAQTDLVQQVRLGKELMEENMNLKAKNESILKEIDQEKLNQVKFEAESGDMIAEIVKLQREIQERGSSLSKLRGTLDTTMTQLVNTQADLQKAQIDITERAGLGKKLAEENVRLITENESILSNLDQDRLDRVKFEAEHGNNNAKIASLQQEIQERESRILELSQSLDATNTQLLNTKTDLQKAQTNLNTQADLAKELKDEIINLKVEKESILRDLDQVKSEAEHGDTNSQIANLQRGIQERDSSLSELRGKFDATMRQLENIQDSLQKAQSEEQDARLKYKKIEADQTDATSRIRDLEHNGQSSSTRIQDLEHDVQNSSTRIRDLEHEVQNASTRIRDLEHEVQNGFTTIRNLEQEVENSSTRISDLEHEVQIRDTIVTNLNHELKESKATIQVTRVDLEKAKLDMERDRLQRLKYGTDHLESTSRISKLQFEVLDAESVISELREALVLSESELHNVSSELQKIESELTSCESKLKGVLDENQSLRLEKAEIVKIMEEERQNNNKLGAEIQHFVTNGGEEDGDTESYKERIRELESKLTDKNKALKLRQQQLQDLRKTLAKEMRNTPAPAQLVPSEPIELFSKSSSQTSLTSMSNEVRVEEISQTDNEPAIIQSINSHHTDASRCYAEDVNFQYLKTVVFKFVTSPDPQVTQHLTKVVSTLLHLSDEESRILEKCTDKRLMTWLGSREHQGY